VSEVWVTNASPIITLAKAGFLELLTQLSGELLLPIPVAQEILAGPPTDPARRSLEDGWGRRVRASAIPSELTEWGLDIGETAALAVALERMPCTVVLDDRAARTCARAFGIPHVGTLGVVVLAKKRGLIPNAAAIMRELNKAGLHLDDQILVQVLAQLGETWSSFNKGV
jgi:predicted nucleic acid-binding protein